MVRLDILVSHVHHHPQQGRVHLLLHDSLIAHLVHVLSSTTLSIHVQILHPCCEDSVLVMGEDIVGNYVGDEGLRGKVA